MSLRRKEMAKTSRLTAGGPHSFEEVNADCPQLQSYPWIVKKPMKPTVTLEGSVNHPPLEWPKGDCKIVTTSSCAPRTLGALATRNNAQAEFMMLTFINFDVDKLHHLSRLIRKKGENGEVQRDR